jgi:hypothetical protein
VHACHKNPEPSLLLLLLVSQRSSQVLSSGCLSNHPSTTGNMATALQRLSSSVTDAIVTQRVLVEHVTAHTDKVKRDILTTYLPTVTTVMPAINMFSKARDC